MTVTEGRPKRKVTQHYKATDNKSTHTHTQRLGPRLTLKVQTLVRLDELGTNKQIFCQNTGTIEWATESPVALLTDGHVSFTTLQEILGSRASS